jgi:hypothetical protein
MLKNNSFKARHFYKLNIISEVNQFQKKIKNKTSLDDRLPAASIMRPFKYYILI